MVQNTTNLEYSSPYLQNHSIQRL